MRRLKVPALLHCFRDKGYKSKIGLFVWFILCETNKNARFIKPEIFTVPSVTKLKWPGTYSKLSWQYTSYASHTHSKEAVKQVSFKLYLDGY